MTQLSEIKARLIEQFYEHKNIVFITLIVGFCFVAVLFAIQAWNEVSEKETLNYTKVTASDDKPSDFLDPFGHLPAPQIIEIVTQSPAPIPPMPILPLKEYSYLGDIIDYDDIQPFKPSLEDMKRQQNMNKRRFSVSLNSRSRKNGNIKTQHMFEDVSRDLDFSVHDLEKSIPTYPVDLSRTLPAFKSIPAVLMTEINSEIASKKVLAQIEQDVYAFHGRKILIPKGSQAIGSYKPLKEMGDERLAIVWKRILTPSGINIIINAETQNQWGSAGLEGEVNNRFMDKYGTALLFSSLSALSQLSVPADNEKSAAVAESFSTEFGNITADSVRQSFDIKPKITIASGTRLNISILTDIWFKKQNIREITVQPIPKTIAFQKYKER